MPVAYVWVKLLSLEILQDGRMSLISLLLRTAQTDKELFVYYLLRNGRIFIHFGQPSIFFLLEWQEVPSYPYLTGKWCSYPNTIDQKPRMYVRTL